MGWFGKSAAALCLALGAFGTLATTSVAQEKTVHYVGTLSGGGNSCNLNSSDIQIDIQGEDMKGHWTTIRGTKASFRGKMTGSSFTTEYKMKAGDIFALKGEIKDNKLDVRVTGLKCNYRASLSPQ